MLPNVKTLCVKEKTRDDTVTHKTFGKFNFPKLQKVEVALECGETPATFARMITRTFKYVQHVKLEYKKYYDEDCGQYLHDVNCFNDYAEQITTDKLYTFKYERKNGNRAVVSFH